MSRRSRSSIVRGVACFPGDGAASFAIDDFKLSLSPRDRGLRTRLARQHLVIDPLKIRDTIALGLDDPAKVRVVRPGGEACLGWEAGGAYFQQALGAAFGARSTTLVVGWNPLRAVRSVLSAEDKRPLDPAVTNYIDPRVVPADEVKKRCLGAVAAFLTRIRGEYVRIIEKLFGVRIAPEDVLVSVNVIELAWDVYSPFLAQQVPSFLAPSWKLRLPEGRRVFRVVSVTESGDGALEAVGRVSEPDEADEGVAAGRGGVLKGRDKKGLILKLYAKTLHVARFELQLSGKSARSFLGRALDPASEESFADQLETIATVTYPRILAVQAEAASSPVVSVMELIAGLCGDESASYVLGALLANGRVKNRGQQDYRRLLRLRARGFVKPGPGKGWWSCTDALAEVSRLLLVAQSASERRSS